jgi:hypothetical protein
MPRLFHATIASLFVGDVINPGRHGVYYRSVIEGSPYPSHLISYLWEVALESARVSAAPEKPSRLSCVFASESLDWAREFKTRYRDSGSSILLVEPVADVAMHRGDFELLRPCGGPFVDVMASRARSYWLDEPVGLPEILVPCGLRVLEVCE